MIYQIKFKKYVLLNVTFKKIKINIKIKTIKEE